MAKRANTSSKKQRVGATQSAVGLHGKPTKHRAHVGAPGTQLAGTAKSAEQKAQEKEQERTRFVSANEIKDRKSSTKRKRR
jgi:hypothetical protein